MGSYLPAVEIDDWGTFKFVVARVCTNNGLKQRVMVRGRNYCTQAKILDDLTTKVRVQPPC